MTILEQLAGYARERTEKAKQKRPLSTLRQQAFSMPKGSFAFENAIKKPELSFICECKKASPSRGIIVSDFPYIQIAKEYENAGADCISVLTEPGWFLGKDAYLREIAEVVSIPCLRKDFTVDEYMLYEAKVLGASAVLLICSILSERQIQEYIGICDEMGISALVEAHDEKEVTMAVRAGARLIGINNRNLKDFTVDTDNSRRFREMIPPEILFVSESGICSAEDVKRLREIGTEELKSLLDPKIKAVGVFVNEDLKRIEEICDKKVIDIVQLHGLEEEKELNYLRSRIVQPVIKAFCIKKEEDVRQAERSPADFILLDSGAGTGRTFEWEWIKHMERPYFLAGGIHIDNVEKALEQLKPYAIDVSSGIETEGRKDKRKMAAIMTAVRKERKL